MNNKTFKKIFAVFFLALIFLNIHAQVRTKTFSDSIPKNLLPGKGIVSKIKILEPPSEFKKLQQEVVKDEDFKSKAKLPKFALPSLVNLDLLKEATLTKSDGGILTYALTIKAPVALNIAVHFSEFVLSENAILSIYNKYELTDSITAKENNENKVWETRVYQGSILNIVLKVPSKEVGQSTLKIGAVYFGYKGFEGRFGSPGASASCNINVACALGAGWETERNSIAIIKAGSGYGSGVLVMNTCNTNTPYFLTAKHVLDQGGPVANWVFQFFYFSTVCGSNSSYREDIQFNGATVKASSAASDFALVQLNQTPPSNSGIHYAGWNRGSVLNSLNFTGLHHPNADVMKISRSTNGILRSADGPYDPNQHWRVVWTQGITAAGSSGSPLFDSNHRILGQLHYGNSYCSTPNAPDYYGSFDRSWTGGSTNTTRLSNWLDPNNTGAFATNTTNVSNLTNAKPALSISGNSALCSSDSYTLNGATAGTISWTSSNTSIATVTQGNPATVTKVGNGAVNITATVTFCPGVTTEVTKTISVGVPNNYYIQSMSYNNPRLDIYPSFTGYQLSVTSWSVYVDGSFSTSGSGYPPSVISVYAGCGSHNVTLTTSNSCGSYSTSSYYSGSGCFAITPNPANGNVTITEETANTKSSSPGGKTLALIGGKVTITVFDNTNRPLKQFTFSKSSRYNFSIASLTPGIYTVQIKQNGSINSLKLIKQ